MIEVSVRFCVCELQIVVALDAITEDVVLVSKLPLREFRLEIILFLAFLIQDFFPCPFGTDLGGEVMMERADLMGVWRSANLTN